MEFLCTQDPRLMRTYDAVMLSAGIDSRWRQAQDGHGRWLAVLDVPVSDLDRAAQSIGEMHQEDRERPVEKPLDRRPLYLQPAFAASVVGALGILLFFWHTGASSGQSSWFMDGPLKLGPQGRAHFWQQSWHWLTAATLHADFRHAAGNAFFFWLLGWAAAERIGPGAMLAGFVFTAVTGFWLSLGLSDGGQTIGASGGVFGLLGLAGGHGWRYASRHWRNSRQGYRTIAAALMLLAFNAFGPQSNIEAHLGGFFGGVGMGLLLPKTPAAPHWQLGLGLGAVGLLAAAWVGV